MPPQIDRISGMCFCAQPLIEMGVLWIFCLGWAQTVMLLISVSRVARIQVWATMLHFFPIFFSLNFMYRDHILFTYTTLFFGWYWGLNSGLHTCKAGALPPHLQFILLGYFGDGGFTNYLPGLVSLTLPILASKIVRITGVSHHAWISPIQLLMDTLVVSTFWLLWTILTF
jgi:hypothetical protein